MDLKLMFFNVWVRCYSYNNKFILRNRRRRKQSKLRPIYDAALAIMTPWFLLRWGALVAYEAVYGKARVNRQMKRERSQTFTHEMGMVAIAKLSSPALPGSSMPTTMQWQGTRQSAVGWLSSTLTSS